ADHLVPPQTLPHIGDELDAAGVSWAWYAGGWNEALAGTANPYFSAYEQPFNYFADMADDAAGAHNHIKDQADLLAALSNGTLPSVAFFKPDGPEDQHPGEGGLILGDGQTDRMIQAIQNSPYWKSTAIIVTYDENGGFYDHVTPPT